MKRFLLYCCFLYSYSTLAQEGIGQFTDNFLPVNQVKLNPADMVDQRPWLSVNLLGAHAYLRNNFAHLQDTRLRIYTTEPTPVFDPPPGRFGKAFVTAEVLGPSATLAYKTHAFGFHTSFRSYANFNRIPSVVGQIIADEGPENIADGTYSMRNGRVKTMSWAQVGLSYGRNFYARNDIMIDGGITLNRLLGVHQASLTIREGVVDVLNGQGTLRQLDGQYSFSEPGFNAGRGWGTTIGATYKKMNDYTESYSPHSKSSGCKWLGYKYKIGLSLVDLGYIRFNQEARTASLPDTTTINDVENVEEDVLGVEQTRFTGILPTALSAKLDYNIKDAFYANVTIVQRISLRNSFGVERSNMLSISPRFESSLFTVSLPFSLANYETPQLGIYFRVGPLAVGTDHLSAFVIKRDQRAASIFVYLNIALQSPACREKKPDKIGKWFCPVW